MKFSIRCLLRGHQWLPWSFNGERSRRFCAACGHVEIVPGEDRRS